MRKWGISVTRWLHAILILSLIIPTIYAIGLKQENSMERNLYLSCMLIVIPVIATDVFIKKCRGIAGYLLCGTLLFCATGVIAVILGNAVFHNSLMWGYTAMLLAETFFVLIERLLLRLNKSQGDKENRNYSPYWKPAYDILENPGAAVMIYFLAIYVIGKNFVNPYLCNEALLSSILYFIVWMIHQFLTKTEEYLSLNKRVCNLPGKRLYGISGGILAILILVLLLMSAPALLTMNNRQYSDFRQWLAERKTDDEELFQSESRGRTPDPMGEVIEQMGPPKQTPVWLSVIFQLMGAAICALVLFLAFRAVQAVFQNFREAYDENGDVIEELSRVTIGDKMNTGKKRQTAAGDGREQIRREYRKMIRRYRKEVPAVYETPLEIETAAGIAGDAECRKLHEKYEKARYGQM